MGYLDRFVLSCQLIAHFYVASTIACNHCVHISSWVHHCSCSFNWQQLSWCHCSCRSWTSLWLHLWAGDFSCLLLWVRKLHHSHSCKFAKCIALAFVQFCDLHHNCTCNVWRFFVVPLLAVPGRSSGVYCLGGIFWCSCWKLVAALYGRDWGDSHGFIFIRCHVMADTTIDQNLQLT